jgi:hypothetical protein
MSNVKCQILSFEVATIFILTLLSSIMINSQVRAAMLSPDYKIQMPNLNFPSSAMGGSENKPGLTGETPPAPYSSAGYKVRAGFWYLKSIVPFGFAISPTTIDFGSLTSNTPVTDSITLTVSAGGVGGYQVAAQESRPLTSSAGNTIPDTTCDDGNCTETTASTWIQNTTYGFGYTLFGNDVPSPFPITSPAGNQYKQFSNRLFNETPEPVMSSNQIGSFPSATVTLKVNISGIQAAGTYQNQIIFVATPTY